MAAFDSSGGSKSMSRRLWLDLNTKRILVLLLALQALVLLTPFMFLTSGPNSDKFWALRVAYFGGWGVMLWFGIGLFTVAEPRERREAIERVMRDARRVKDWCVQSAVAMHESDEASPEEQRVLPREYIVPACVDLSRVAEDEGAWIERNGVRAVRRFIHRVEVTRFWTMPGPEARSISSRYVDLLRRDLR